MRYLHRQRSLTDSVRIDLVRARARARYNLKAALHSLALAVRFPREGRPNQERAAVTSNSARGQCQAGSLTGAVHLSNGNAGVLRPAQREQKSRAEQKGKSWLDPDFQYEYGLGNEGLSILQRYVASYRYI